MVYTIVSILLIVCGILGFTMHRLVLLKIQSGFLVVSGILIAFSRATELAADSADWSYFASIIIVVYLLIFLAAVIKIYFHKSADTQKKEVTRQP